MKKLFSLLLAMFTCFTLSAQLDISGGCFDADFKLYQDADIDGKASFQGRATYQGAVGEAQLRWVAVNGGDWVLYWEGNPVASNTEDTTGPTDMSSAWTSSTGLCASAPTVK